MTSVGLACVPEGNSDRGFTRHPTEANAPPANAIPVTDDREPPGLAGERLERWRKARELLTTARTVASVGSNKQGPELFGKIADARVDGGGQLVVLDQQAASVSVFSADGTYLHGFGGRGEGPLEMFRPLGLELLGDDRVVVYDWSLEAKVFARRRDKWQLERIVSIPTIVEDNCAFADRFFLAGAYHMASNQGTGADGGLDDQTLFFEVAELGAAPRVNFRGGYRDASAQIRHQLSRGKIACMPAVKQVVFGVDVLPIVRSYAANSGNLLWSAYVRNYWQMRLEEQRDGGFRIYNRLAHDYLISVAAMPSRHIVLQYLRVGYMREFVAVRTYLVDGETGEGALVGEMLPRIQSVHQYGYVVSFDRPYPRVEVRAFEPR